MKQFSSITQYYVSFSDNVNVPHLGEELNHTFAGFLPDFTVCFTDPQHIDDQHIKPIAELAPAIRSEVIDNMILPALGDDADRTHIAQILDRAVLSVWARTSSKIRPNLSDLAFRSALTEAHTKGYNTIHLQFHTNWFIDPSVPLTVLNWSLFAVDPFPAPKSPPSGASPGLTASDLAAALALIKGPSANDLAHPYTPAHQLSHTPTSSAPSSRRPSVTSSSTASVPTLDAHDTASTHTPAPSSGPLGPPCRAVSINAVTVDPSVWHDSSHLHAEDPSSEVVVDTSESEIPLDPTFADDHPSGFHDPNFFWDGVPFVFQDSHHQADYPSDSSYDSDEDFQQGTF